LATIIGARLGHVLFYEPAKYLSNPIDILKIWEGGLASHGAAISIPIALWIFCRQNQGMRYLWVVDRIVIVVALTGALIRLGNLMNSEIGGKDTNSYATCTHRIH
jgi:prolipoprotein diacylglyceryltransferase